MWELAPWDPPESPEVAEYSAGCGGDSTSTIQENTSQKIPRMKISKTPGPTTQLRDQRCQSLFICMLAGPLSDLQLCLSFPLRAWEESVCGDRSLGQMLPVETTFPVTLLGLGPVVQDRWPWALGSCPRKFGLPPTNRCSSFQSWKFGFWTHFYVPFVLVTFFQTTLANHRKRGRSRSVYLGRSFQEGWVTSVWVFW
jgi:hypothetical protein